MAGFMGGLDADSYDRKFSDRELFGRILERFSPQRSRLLRLSLLVLLQGAAGASVPLIISRALDILQARAELQVLVGTIGLVAAVGVFDWTLNYFNQRTAARAVGELVRGLRADALSHVLRRDMRFFDQQLVGKITSRVTGDTQEMGALVQLFTEMLSSLLIILFVTLIMLYKSVFLTFCVFLTAPLILGATTLFRRIARKTSTASRRVAGLLNGQIQESISGISIAKSFRQEQAVYDAFMRNNQLGYEVNLRQGFSFNAIFPVLNVLMGVGTALVLYLGGSAALESQTTGITPGDWYFFLQSLGLIFFPLTSLASFYSQLQNGLAAGERVFVLLEETSQLRQVGDGIEPGRLKGAIRLKDVHFHYVPGEPVFQGLTLDIHAGESVALVGHTGAGKSSIVNLLSRYYEFQSGSVSIDGHNIRALDVGAYRRQLGIILQEQLLFDATVAENIRYGRPDATEAEVLDALRRLDALSLVEELPQGLNTRVRERGSRLSIGQRQLISLARTILQDPAILVLDEATASVDPLTEVRLQRALERLMKGRTTLIIAHRLTTIRHCDRIVALDHGRIVEEGTHTALMARGGYYATLYDTYFRHQSLEYIEQLGNVA